MVFGNINNYLGLPIFCDEAMVEIEFYDKVEQKTFRERWIEPLLHPVVVNFEPWVKYKIVQHQLTKPSKKVLQTQQGFFMHPLMKKELMTVMNTLNSSRGYINESTLCW